MEEHALLQRGQRIDLRHIRRPARDRGKIRSICSCDRSTSGSIAGVMRSAPPSGTSRGGTATASCPACGGQQRRGRRREQRPHRQHGQAVLPQPLRQRHRQQRMTAQLEETVLRTDPVHTQHLSEHPAGDLLAHRRRAPALAAAGPPGRAGRAGRSCRWWSAAMVQHGHRVRHHVLRAAARTRSARTARRQLRRACARHRRGPRTRQAACRRGCPPGRSPRPAPPPGSAARTASTSPGSIRNPRILTWSSARPRYSSCPSGVHRARSPVRYIRSPRHERARHEPARGQPRPPVIPPRQPRPGHIQLPRHPGRHRAQPPVQHEHPRVRDRPADRAPAARHPVHGSTAGSQCTSWSR